MLKKIILEKQKASLSDMVLRNSFNSIFISDFFIQINIFVIHIETIDQSINPNNHPDNKPPVIICLNIVTDSLSIRKSA